MTRLKLNPGTVQTRLAAAAAALAAPLVAPAQTVDYVALAEVAVAAHPSPFTFGVIPSRPEVLGNESLRTGEQMYFGCATDDPWLHPFVDAFT